MNFTGPEIKHRREARRLTQQQLADAIDVSRRSVISWERGEAAPQGRFIGQLERVLGDTVNLADVPTAELLAELARRIDKLEA